MVSTGVAGLARNGWQLFAGTLYSVPRIPCHLFRLVGRKWQVLVGMPGSLSPEQVAGFPRNGWQVWAGILTADCIA